jgi:hypothetical protein
MSPAAEKPKKEKEVKAKSESPAELKPKKTIAKKEAKEPKEPKALKEAKAKEVKEKKEKPVEKKEKKSKGKKEKEGGEEEKKEKVKRPHNAWMLYYNEVRAEVMAAHPEAVGVPAIAKLIGAMYRELPDAKRDAYKAQAATLAAEHKAKLAAAIA